MTITARPTPNPNSLKFEVDGTPLTDEPMLAFHSLREAAAHPLAADLFALRGVESLLIVPAFVTVTKHPAADWDLLSDAVEAVLSEHLG